MRRIKSNLRSIKDEESLLIYLYIAVAFSATLGILGLLSFFDVLFHFKPWQKAMVLLILAVSLMAMFALKIAQIPQKVTANLKKLFRTNRQKFHYSPQVLYDIEQGRVSTEDEATLVDWQEQVQSEDRSLFTTFGLKALLKFHSTPWLIASQILVVAIILLVLVLGLNPFRIVHITSKALLPRQAYLLTPRGGTYFYGQPLKMRFLLKSSKYKFLAFEKASEAGDFNLFEEGELVVEKVKDGVAYNLTVPALVKDFSFRVVAAKGIEKLTTSAFNIKVRYPAHFKQVSFSIRPPAYTGVGPYTSSENLQRVYFGSTVQATVKTSKSARVSINGKLLPGTDLDEARQSTYSFRFASFKERKIQFDLLEKTEQATVKVQSPVYEFWPAEDNAPKVQILSSEKTIAAIKLPELGKLSWQFSAEDDFGLRHVAVYIIENAKVLKTEEIKLSSLSKKRVGKNNIYLGSVQIDLSSIKAASKNLAIYMGVRDNSLIRSAFSWQSQKEPGQIAQSQGILIELPQDAIKKEKWQAANEEKLARELELYQQEYARSERELKDILKKAQAGAESSEVKAELQKWLERRKTLKKNLGDLQKRLAQNVKASDSGQDAQKKRILENIAKTLEEEISVREKELSRLMKNFPRDYMVANKQIQRLSKKEYLKNLENSISQLKRLLAIKKISQLKKKLESELAALQKLQDKLATKAATEGDQKQIAQHQKNIKDLQKEAASLDKSIEPKPRQNLRMANKQKENWQKAMQKASQGMQQGKRGQAISAMSQGQEALEKWKQQFDQAMNSLGAGEMKKAVKAFRESAFRINEISQVWQKRFNDAKVNPQVADKKKLRKLGEDISTIRDSYRAVVTKLIKKVGKSGLVDASLLASLNESYNFFQNVQGGIENNLPMSTISNSKRLIWKFNRTSLQLLKEMAKMRTQMAQISGQRMGEQMQKTGKMQGKMQGQIQKMGKGQGQGQQQGLNEAEKAYLNELARREKAARNALKSLANSKELEGTSAQKEAQALLKEIKKLEGELKTTTQRRSLAKTEKKLKKLNQRFLKSRKSIKRRKEFDRKREAEKPKEYRIQAPVKFVLPEKELAPEIGHDLDLSEAQKLFFREYLNNLQNSQK